MHEEGNLESLPKTEREAVEIGLQVVTLPLVTVSLPHTCGANAAWQPFCRTREL